MPTSLKQKKNKKQKKKNTVAPWYVTLEKFLPIFKLQIQFFIFCENPSLHKPFDTNVTLEMCDTTNVWHYKCVL